MGLALLFTVVASNLVHSYTPVYCRVPPIGWGDTARYVTEGMTMFSPTRIYIRDCVHLEVEVLGHEVLHAIHPVWPEGRVYAMQDEEGVLVRRELHWVVASVL